MADIQLGLLGTFDLATGDEVNKLKDSVDALGDKFPGRTRAVRKRIPQSVTLTQTATFLSFGTPPAGSVWLLVEVVVPSPLTGKCQLYLGTPPLADTQIPLLGGVVRPEVVVPNVFIFQRDFTALENEQVYVWFYGAPGATANTFAATLTVIELPSDALERNVI